MMVSLCIRWFLVQCAYGVCKGSAKVFITPTSFQEVFLVQRHTEALGLRIVDNTSKADNGGDYGGHEGDGGHNGTQVPEVDMPRLAIVSAQYGENDKIFSLANLPKGVQGFFFTDNRDIRSIGRGWTVVHRPYHLEGVVAKNQNTHGKYSFVAHDRPNVNLLMAGRFYKLNAYLLEELKDADMILWTDASCVDSHSRLNGMPADSLATRADALLGSDEFIAQKHGKRRSVAREIPSASQRAADRVDIDVNDVMDDMWRGFKFMESQGFKDDLGLLHSETLLYRAKSPAVHAAMSYWWAFVQNYTFRDQISYPWALKFNNVKVRVPCASGCSKTESCILYMLKGPLDTTCSDWCTGPCSTEHQDLKPSDWPSHSETVG